MQQGRAMLHRDTLLRKSKSLCTDHDCPECGTRDHVTAECVLIGDLTITVCHCRVCGHSWHPQVEADPV
jgi:transcription elongation factor Elf1